MPLISYQVGMTMHLGDPKNNEYIKQTVEVTEFDTSVDLDEQIQQVHETFHKLAQWADEQLADKMMKALGNK